MPCACLEARFLAKSECLGSPTLYNTSLRPWSSRTNKGKTTNARCTSTRFEPKRMWFCTRMVAAAKADITLLGQIKPEL